MAPVISTTVLAYQTKPGNRDRQYYERASFCFKLTQQFKVCTSHPTTIFKVSNVYNGFNNWSKDFNQIYNGRPI